MNVTSPDPRPQPASGQLADDAGQPDLLEWQAQLRASAGFRAIALQNQVKRMSYLLQGNVAQYRSLVARLQDPSVFFPITDVRTPDAHDDLLSEAERLLHNVLTAMSTRIDQQRRFMDKHFQDDPALMAEYREKIASSITPSPEAAFLKGLRNYITHRQLPVAQSRETIGLESITVTFILPGEPLLTWDDWNSTVRAWIAGHGEAIPIVDVVDAYARITAEFDKWLYARIGLKHKTEIGAFLCEQQTYARVVDQVFGASSPADAQAGGQTTAPAGSIRTDPHAASAETAPI